ncbi:hypothetical protein pEaSNUABM46_00088 [Erwinia phage pEa_SNUABM_46]|nr:hypothetical protein pEaSNUABM46_00088 [Erwinia phage pEa_SNUABM_46]
MEILPYNPLLSGNAQYFGLLYDTDAPADGEKGIHSAFNEAVAMRLFNMARIGSPIASQFTPSISSTTFSGNNFVPSWIETVPRNSAITVPAGAKRIVPKVRFAPIDQRFSTQAQYYNEAVAAAMIAHHFDSIVAFSTSGNRTLSTIYNTTAEGWWLCAEYDFGAEIELKSILGTTCGSTNSTYMITNTQQTILQAQVDGQWIDAVDVFAATRVSTNYGSNHYVLPASVKAQKFRVVNKNPTFPWSTVGHYPFGLHFFGNYTTTKPRTLGKYKHMTMLHVIPAAGYTTATEWSFNYPAAITTVLGRYCSMFHVTITDDLTKAATSDIYMRDATYTLDKFTDVPVPAFKVRADAIVGRGV